MDANAQSRRSPRQDIEGLAWCPLFQGSSCLGPRECGTNTVRKYDVAVAGVMLRSVFDSMGPSCRAIGSLYKDTTALPPVYS